MTNDSTFKKTFNLNRKMIQLDYQTIQHDENNSTCIFQYHFARYIRMHVESFLHECKVIHFGSSLMLQLKEGTNGEGEHPSIVPHGIIGSSIILINNESM